MSNADLPKQLRKHLEAVLTYPDLPGGDILGYYTDLSGNRIRSIWVGTREPNFKVEGLEVIIPYLPFTESNCETGNPDGYGRLHSETTWQIFLVQHKSDRVTLPQAVERIKRSLPASQGRRIGANDALKVLEQYCFTFKTYCLGDMYIQSKTKYA